MHISIGVIFALYFLLMAFTGVVMNHTQDWGFTERYVSRSYLPLNYRPQDGDATRYRHYRPPFRSDFRPLRPLASRRGDRVLDGVDIDRRGDVVIPQVGVFTEGPSFAMIPPTPN